MMRLWTALFCLFVPVAANAAIITEADNVTASKANHAAIDLLGEVTNAERPLLLSMGQPQTPDTQHAQLQQFICFEVLAQNTVNLMQFTASVQTEAKIDSIMLDNADDAEVASLLKNELGQLARQMAARSEADTLPDSCYADKNIRLSTQQYKDAFDVVERSLRPIANRLGVK